MIYLSDCESYDRLVWKGINSSSIEEIYGFLIDVDYRVRTLASQVVQIEYPTKKSFQKAKKMTKSKKWEHREIGAYILGQLGTPKTPFIKQSLPILVNLFDDKNEDVISSAISSVGHLLIDANLPYDKKLAKKIIKFAKHKNPAIRVSVMFALASFEYTKDIKKCLKKVLKKDKNREVREWAELAIEILEDR